MRYQLGADGEVLRCEKCGEWLRSSPVYDTYPVCSRKTCKNVEAIAKHIHDVMTDLFGLPNQGDVVTGGEDRGTETGGTGQKRGDGHG